MVTTLGDGGGDDNERLVLSMWDYGGQKVFNTLHHLFLTRHGGYVLAFNLEHLVDGASDECRAHALAVLDFWLRSLHLHARGAPVFLAGTRADIVSDPATLLRVSQEINARYRREPFFDCIQQPPANGLRGIDSRFMLFFPLNNKAWETD